MTRSSREVQEAGAHETTLAGTTAQGEGEWELLDEMRGLLEEILAADTQIATANFEVLYVTTQQLERIRKAVMAGRLLLSRPAQPQPIAGAKITKK